MYRGLGDLIRQQSFDCLTEPGIVWRIIASRSKQKPVFGAAMIRLYEAREGVSRLC